MRFVQSFTFNEVRPVKFPIDVGNFVIECHPSKALIHFPYFLQTLEFFLNLSNQKELGSQETLFQTCLEDFVIFCNLLG